MQQTYHIKKPYATPMMQNVSIVMKNAATNSLVSLFLVDRLILRVVFYQTGVPQTTDFLMSLVFVPRKKKDPAKLDVLTIDPVPGSFADLITNGSIEYAIAVIEAWSGRHFMKSAANEAGL